MSLSCPAHFFLYGLFAPGQIFYPLFQDFVKSSQPADVVGELHITHAGVPILLESQSGQNVQATLCEMVWTKRDLDRLDGIFSYDRVDPGRSLFLRQKARSQGHHSAESYWLNPRSKRILQGPQTGCSPLSQMSPEDLTILAQIGSQAPAGPLALSIYRKLVALRLIRDAERGFTLTPIGVEVYRFAGAIQISSKKL